MANTNKQPVVTDENGVRWRNKARLCNARNNTCGACAVKGSEKCKNHGGKSLKGVENPHFKHGRYTKSRFVNMINALSDDPDLRNMMEEIKLVVVGIQTLIADEGDQETDWGEVRTLIDQKRKIVEGINRHEVAMNYMLSMTEWQTAIVQMMDVHLQVMRTVLDSPGKYTPETAHDLFQQKVGELAH